MKHPEPERADGETRVWSPTLGRYLPSLDFAKPVGHDGDHEPLRIEDTCCGKCPGATCYVDFLTGERP